MLCLLQEMHRRRRPISEDVNAHRSHEQDAIDYLELVAPSGFEELL